MQKRAYRPWEVKRRELSRAALPQQQQQQYFGTMCVVHVPRGLPAAAVWHNVRCACPWCVTRTSCFGKDIRISRIVSCLARTHPLKYGPAGTYSERGGPHRRRTSLSYPTCSDTTSEPLLGFIALGLLVNKQDHPRRTCPNAESSAFQSSPSRPSSCRPLLRTSWHRLEGGITPRPPSTR
jgi:hypothetical protein